MTSAQSRPTRCRLGSVRQPRSSRWRDAGVYAARRQRRCGHAQRGFDRSKAVTGQRQMSSCLQGALIQGTPYVATYNASDGAFYLQGGLANPYNIPFGGLLPYIGFSTPNSALALPYRAGDLADGLRHVVLAGRHDIRLRRRFDHVQCAGFAGRFVAGLDNMGGSGANRLNTAIPSTSLGAFGGEQQHQARGRRQFRRSPPCTSISSMPEHTTSRHQHFRWHNRRQCRAAEAHFLCFWRVGGTLATLPCGSATRATSLVHGNRTTPGQAS